MGILNNTLGINLTNEYPLTNNPFNISGSGNFVPTPPISDLFLLLDGSDFLLLDGENLTLL